MADNTTTSGAAAAGDGFDFELYRYTPSLPAAVIFVVVFAILSGLHVWRLQRHHALYFTAFTVGGFFELVGYCGRIWSHFDPTSIGGFVLQAIPILVAPALFAASVYMILGRLVRALGPAAERLAVVPPRWVTRVFVAGDVVAFTLQAGGGGIQSAGTLALYEIGERVIVAGLLVQIAMFGLFVATAVLFGRRMRGPRGAAVVAEAPSAGGGGGGAVAWRRHLNVLFAVSALILVRSVFRVVEYLQGNGGYLVSHEVFLYIFDAVLMTAVMVIFLVWYVDDLNVRPVSQGFELSSKHTG
ncbi:RTA1 like protein-domain-containing protein [Xylariaceae sp. FL0804]|nr:RTA1 like protein-domain-containing protein [Xylariaceae sp. FL0804]